MTRRLRLAALVATAALALAACASGGATAAPASQPAATTAASAPAAPASAAAGGACSVGTGSGTPAQIKDFAFPTGLSIAAGSAISWTNGDSANHTVTFDDGSCDTPVNAGATVTVTYNTPGTFAFHCTIHPNMTGSLEVK
jgi:plastocyanin